MHFTREEAENFAGSVEYVIGQLEYAMSRALTSVVEAETDDEDQGNI